MLVAQDIAQFPAGPLMRGIDADAGPWLKHGDDTNLSLAWNFGKIMSFVVDIKGIAGQFASSQFSIHDGPLNLLKDNSACPQQGGRMFRTKKRADEPNSPQDRGISPSPKELLAKEAQMAEKLLEDLVPEEPPANKPTQGAMPEVKVEQKPSDQVKVEASKPEDKPADREKKEADEKKPAVEEDKGDELPVLMAGIQTLGTDLVQIRAEVRKLRDAYAAKTKEMEDLQTKLKDTLAQPAL